jgi:hypothetical protein
MNKNLRTEYQYLPPDRTKQPRKAPTRKANPQIEFLRSCVRNDMLPDRAEISVTFHPKGKNAKPVELLFVRTSAIAALAALEPMI